MKIFFEILLDLDSREYLKKFFFFFPRFLSKLGLRPPNVVCTQTKPSTTPTTSPPRWCPLRMTRPSRESSNSGAPSTNHWQAQSASPEQGMNTLSDNLLILSGWLDRITVFCFKRLLRILWGGAH